MSFAPRVRFTSSFPQLPEPVVEFWRELVEYLAIAGALPKQFILSEIAGHPEHLKPSKGKPDLVLTPNEIEAVIIERGLTGFAVDTGHSEHSIAFNLRKYSHIQGAEFTSRIERRTKAPDDWKPLIETLLSRWSSVGAWQFLIPYQVWQWASEKNELYEKFFGPFPPGFRTYPDPDWDGMFERRTFIDISKNSGRPRCLKPDVKFYPINFYPTAEMWLGPHFWQYAKCTKGEALAANFFIEKRDTPHYLYLKCWPHPFTRPDGEQGRMQQRLWKLFFHEDCEWPPGSGTISDEPMYGPPELMPGYKPPAE